MNYSILTTISEFAEKAHNLAEQVDGLGAHSRVSKERSIPASSYEAKRTQITFNITRENACLNNNEKHRDKVISQR
jgi:hypothetical protein